MKQEIDQFFQEVMVFDDNEQIARNRIRLLNSKRTPMFNRRFVRA